MKTLQALVFSASMVALSGGAAFAQAAVGAPNGVAVPPQATQPQAAPAAPQVNREVNRERGIVNRRVEGNRGNAAQAYERGNRYRYGAAVVPAPYGAPEGRWNSRWRDRDGDGRWDGRMRDRRYYGGNQRYYGEDRRSYGYTGWRDRGWYEGPSAGVGFWPFSAFTGFDNSYDDPVYLEPAPRRVWVERRGRGYDPIPGRRNSGANPSRGADSGR